MSVYDSLKLLTPDDWNAADYYTRSRVFEPDVILAPDGEPYLFRWHIVYDNRMGNVFFHIQVKSDPERPLHDHPWDNMSVILSGGYDELYWPRPFACHSSTQDILTMRRALRKGDSVYRPARTAHRLLLPDFVPYTMTLFTTGPKVREWGFWYPDGFHHNKRHVDDRPNDTSVRHGMVSIGRHDQ